MPTARLGLRSSVCLRGCPRARTDPQITLVGFWRLKKKLESGSLCKSSKNTRNKCCASICTYVEFINEKIAVKWCFEHLHLHIYNITVIHTAYSLVPLKNVLCCYDHRSHPATKKRCFFVITTTKDCGTHHLISRDWRLHPPNLPATKNKNKNLVREMKETCSWIGLIWPGLGVPRSSLITTGKRDGLSGPTGGGCVWVHPSAWSAASYQGNHWAAVNGDHLVPIHTVGRSRRAHVIFI